jgi:hypothetical protein
LGNLPRIGPAGATVSCRCTNAVATWCCAVVCVGAGCGCARANALPHTRRLHVSAVNAMLYGFGLAEPHPWPWPHHQWVEKMPACFSFEIHWTTRTSHKKTHKNRNRVLLWPKPQTKVSYYMCIVYMYTSSVLPWMIIALWPLVVTGDLRRAALPAASAARSPSVQKVLPWK